MVDGGRPVLSEISPFPSKSVPGLKQRKISIPLIRDRLSLEPVFSNSI